MANNENLITPTSAQAREKGRKGGKKQTVAQKMANRVYCTGECPIFDQCRYKHISRANHEAELNKARKKGIKKTSQLRKIKRRCALKETPSAQQERILRFTLEGEEGIHRDLIDTVSRLADLVEEDPSPFNLRSYAKQLTEMHKCIYGDKHKIESKTEGTISADDFADAYEEFKKKEKK